MNKIVGISFAILLLPAFTFIEVFAQEGNNTKMTVEFSCKTGPNSNLLCWNSEIGLCILRTDLTDAGGGLMWNIVNRMLCEAGESNE